MTITLVDDAKGTWRRVYIDRDLVLEGHPLRISLKVVLEKLAQRLGNGLKLQMRTVEDFNMLEEAGGIAIA